MPAKQVLAPMILPLLISGFLVQALVPMVRILTSYQALGLGYSAETIGVISAVFALLPVFLTVTIGRLNDGGALGRVMVCGAVGGLAACVVFWLGPPGLVTLLLSNALLGISQTAVLAGLQVVTARASSRAHRDSILGNYMVAISLGQAFGPLVIGFGHESPLLAAVPCGAAVLLLAVLAVLARRLPPTRAMAKGKALPLHEIAATRGLWWVIVFGGLCVAAQDLLVAFLPVFAVERGLSPLTVGVLLSVRAVAAMLSRLMFGRAVRRFGQMRLALLSAAMGGVAMLALVVPMPVAAVGVAMATLGFGLGIALTCSVALTIQIAPPRARGTALSMRMTAIRLAQFVIPLGAGLVVAPIGAAGTFALSGAAILGAAIARPRGPVGQVRRP